MKPFPLKTEEYYMLYIMKMLTIHVIPVGNDVEHNSNITFFVKDETQLEDVFEKDADFSDDLTMNSALHG